MFVIFSALQKHLFEHDEANANKVESTGDGLNPDKLAKPKPAPSQNVRKKFKAFKKLKVGYFFGSCIPVLYFIFFSAHMSMKC